MVILHIANINPEAVTGVAVAVPLHIKAQSVPEQVAVINITNLFIPGAETQFNYQSNFDLKNLPDPFSRPDIVIFHNTYHIEYVKIARQLIKQGIPYVIVPHGSLVKSAQRKKWLKKTVANWLFFNKFFKCAAAIQFLSERERCASRYRDKGFIGTNGVDIPIHASSVKERSALKMVYIGRTEVYIKGIDLMINAVSLCSHLFEEYNVHLDLYGPDIFGRHAQILELISKHKVEKFVTLHDAVLGKQKEKILLDADCFVQTSRTEGMPMGILEALSYSLPCIITEGTSLGDIVRKYDAGWVADATAHSIANAINKAVQEKSLWCEKSKQARRLIFENYNWEKVVKDTVREYKGIAGRN